MKLTKNKKGFELAVNFLVVIILAIAMFGLSLVLLQKVMKGSTDISEKTQEQLDKAIGNLACKSSDQVCIGTNKKQIYRGEFEVFGVRVINVEETQKFYIKASEQPSSSKLKILPENRGPFELGVGQSLDHGIGIQVNDNADSGNVVVNVEIKKCVVRSPTPLCNSPPADFSAYANGKYKLIVIIP